MNEAVYEQLLAMVEQAVRSGSQESLQTLIEQLKAGTVPREAISQALQQFEGAYYQILADAFSQVLGTSLGVQAIRELPVSGLALSTHLYAQQKTMSEEVLGLIKRHAQGMQDARKLALDIYEGYGFKPREAIALSPNNPQLPKYLREALRDEGLKSELARLIARGQISQIRTPALKAAYSQALDQFEQGAGMDRLERALDVAYQERMRYFANRIAQTELHRTWSDQRARELMADDTVSVVQIVMSRTHPKLDICDLHSSLNQYGLGLGCYPKPEAPKPPFHPFCRCVIKPRRDLDANLANVRKDAEQAWLQSAGDKDGPKVMGSYARWMEAKAGKASVEEIVNRNKDALYHLKRVGDVMTERTHVQANERNAGDWKSMSLPSAKDLAKSTTDIMPALLHGRLDEDSALFQLRQMLGLVDGVSKVGVQTPIGQRYIDDLWIKHIVEKREAARERYAHLIVPTLQTPTEIWRSKYDDGERERFLKFWRDGDKALLVVISMQKGNVLWNVIPMPLRSVDRQREGYLLWKSYQ